MSKNLTTRIKHKYDDAATWASQGWTSKVGEIYVYKPDSDYNYPRMKVGDGVHIVADLPFVEIGDYTPKLIAISTVPSQSGTITYNGSSKTPSWSNYDSAKLTLGGTVTGTNAGDYYATFTPKDGYCWSDGSTTAKSVKWTIGKATPTLSLNKTSITLNDSTPSTTVTVTTNSTGTITATPSPTTYITTSVSSKTITVNNKDKKNGSTTVTVTVAATTNYNARSTTFSVTTSFMQISSTLGMNSWTTIQTVAKAGNASQYWSVGDVKDVYVNYTVGEKPINATLYVYIVGFNRNGLACIDFQGFKDIISNKQVCLYDNMYGRSAYQETNEFVIPAGYYAGSDYGMYWGDPMCQSLIDNALGQYPVHVFNTLFTGLYDDAINMTTTIRDCMSDICYETFQLCIYVRWGDYSEVEWWTNSSWSAVTWSKLILPSPVDLYDTIYLGNTGFGEIALGRPEYEDFYVECNSAYEYYRLGNSKQMYKYDSTSTPCEYWLAGELVIDHPSVPDYGIYEDQIQIMPFYMYNSDTSGPYATDGNESKGVCPIFRIG